MNKKWVVTEKVPQEFIGQFPKFNPVVLQLLYNRGIATKEEMEFFLNPDYERHILDPYLFQDMKKAVKRIEKAIDRDEQITVHGDYDADGVCGAVILFETLKLIGAKVNVYLPHREKEGYGMNEKTVIKLIQSDTKLIVTTDCGVSNKAEVELAKQNGIDVIITDHHEPPAELPKADAILNPHLKGETYPFKYLAGSGVAYKLATALIKEARKNNKTSVPNGFEKWLLDLVAISTITDIVPLIGENRVLVKYGLIVLQKTRRPGLKALLSVIGPIRGQIDTFTIGYQIGPRINAAGRMDHANLAFKLLTADSEPEAEALAAKLQFNNKERQKITESIVQQAKNQIGEFNEEQTLLFVKGEEWPAGIIGLVAGKIADEFYRPALVLTEQAGKVTGSGRSIKEFNIVKALEKTQVYFERWGGHSQACGFTLKKVGLLEEFKIEFEKITVSELSKQELAPSLEIEAELKLPDINWELNEALEQFVPFGEMNPKPKFVAYQARVQDWQRLGERGQHLKLMLSDDSGGAFKKAIGFNFGEFTDKIEIGNQVDFVFELGVNEWNGNRELEIKLVDIKKS